MAPAVDTVGQDCHLEAGLMSAVDKDNTTSSSEKSGPGITAPSERPATPTGRMSTLHQISIVFLVCFIVGSCFSTVAHLRPHTCSDADYSTWEEPSDSMDNSRLAQLWQSTSPDALREMIHKYFPEKYQQEVYETDSEVVETVRLDPSQENPVLPQLIRRQGDGGNGTATTSSAPPDSTTSTSKEPPTTTDETTTSAPTETTSEPPTSKSITSDSPSETTGPPLSSTTTESTITKATSRPVPHTVVKTLGDGVVTTLTSTSWLAVQPPPAQATSDNPDLQDDASRPRRGMVVPIVIGALVGGILMS